MKRSMIGILSNLAAGAALVLSFAAQADNGAVWTTLKGGIRVNANLFPSKDDVYLNGGPQNTNGSGLPDGDYYFQVTNPSGAVLLSTDDIKCRQVTVVGGSIGGSSGDCPHANGDFNPDNASTPVQLRPFDDTPNKGGEYKVWLTLVAAYNECDVSVNFGFCNADTKTDNFKVMKPGVAHVTACKFEDVEGDGNSAGDPVVANWPMNATGVDRPDTSATGETGCVTFTVSTFTANVASVTITEGNLGDNWAQTAPAPGSYPGVGDHQPDYVVDANGVVSIQELFPGDELTVWFGNHRLCPTCGNSIPRQALQVTKDANPAYKVAWQIAKTVDTTRINTSASSATFNYTVSLTHDAGSGFVVNGTIHVANISPDEGADIGGIDVTDAVDDGGICTVTGGTGLFLAKGESVDLTYTCTYAQLLMPGKGTNTATAKWTSFTDEARTSTGTADVDFTNTTLLTVIDGTVDVTDTLGGTLGQATYTDSNPKTFTYSYTVPVGAGTCATQPNTATFTSTTTNSNATDIASQSVKVCRGADLTVSKTAAGSYTSSVTKTAKQTSPLEVGGSTTLGYTVTVTESGWKVTGNITVTNPNDWEDVTVNLSDVVSGASCTIAGGNSQTVPRSSFISPAYTCTFASAPAATSGTNTAYVSWSGASTPHTSTSASAGYSFASLTVKDAFNGGAPVTLGTIPGNVVTTTYSPSYSVSVPAGTCALIPNIADIGNDKPSEADVTVCNTKTNGLTMGFWTNNNGQGLIAALNTSTTAVCPLAAVIQGYAPFSNLSATAPCGKVGSTKATDVVGYVATVIGQANSSGSGAPMLRGQMLATLLTAYFSGRPGNPVGSQGTMANLGNAWILLNPVKGTEDVRKAFLSYNTIAPHQWGETVWTMLSDAGAKWTAAGCTNATNPANCPSSTSTTSYGNKAVLVLASDAFNFINNSQANISP